MELGDSDVHLLGAALSFYLALCEHKGAGQEDGYWVRQASQVEGFQSRLRDAMVKGAIRHARWVRKWEREKGLHVLSASPHRTSARNRTTSRKPKKGRPA
jgi:hypothetical protein